MQPNILYIHSHDSGRYIEPFGYAVPTPCLQQLAQEGVLFRNNHCICPTCSPSRSALLTGIFPHENGMLGLAHRGFSLRDYGEHLVHALKRAGYETALSGIQHVAAAQPTDKEAAIETIGYDKYLGNWHNAETQAAEWVASREPHNTPFFLSVGFVETHRDFPELNESDPNDPRYTMPPAPLPDTPATRQDMAHYKKMARELDRRVGVVMDGLRSAGLHENTLVIATTDHGIAFPRMKCNLEDSGTGTFLILRAGREIANGAFTSGQVVDAMTTHLDIFPTLMEVLGIEAPPRLRGRSLLPLLGGDASEPSLDPAVQDSLHEAIFAEMTFHGSYEPARSVRTARYKYIRRYDGRLQPVLPNVDNGESKSYWMEQGWKSRRPVREALYDLVFDPSETNNLALDPGHTEILDEMRNRLARHLDETEDLIRAGFILPPDGTVLNWPDGDDALSLSFTVGG